MREEYSLYDIGCACLTLFPLIAVSVLLALFIIPPVSADTMILYPNEDRQIQREVAGSNFTSLATGAGTYNTLGATMGVIVLGDTGADTYSLLRAYGVTFNSTILTTNSTVTNASLTLAYNNKLNAQGTPSLVITKFNPANFYSIADNANYQKFINTSIGSISYASFAAGNNTIYLTDLTAVNKTGITALGARLNWHVDQGATSPTWASGGAPSGFYFYTSAQAGTGQDPFLTIVFTPASADTTPPSSLSTFANTTNCSQTNISFTVPADSDYDGFMAWWNNAAETNQTNATTWYNKSGLTALTSYTLSTKTFDLVGNVNATFTNYTITTSACVTPTPTTPVPTTAPPVGCTYTNLTGATLINSTAWSITLGNLSWGTIQNVTEGNVSIWSCIGTPTTAPLTTAPSIPDLPAPDALDNWMGILLGNWWLWLLLFGALLIIMRD